MIVFDLECAGQGHRFEGWFGSSEDFERQRAGGLLACPQCGSHAVDKALMAPRLTRKGNQMPAPSAPAPRTPAAAPAAQAPQALPPEARARLHQAMEAVARAQAEALKSSTWVGERFVEDARAMHYGEKDAAAIHGQASPEQARALIEEGIEVMPLLVPVVPPKAVQ